LCLPRYFCKNGLKRETEKMPANEAFGLTGINSTRTLGKKWNTAKSNMRNISVRIFLAYINEKPSA